MNRGRFFVPALFVLLATFVPMIAADTPQQPPFRASTLAVRVDVAVTDGRRPVSGLTAADFELRDNGVAQSLEVVDATEVPLNVVLALDTSASTSGPRISELIAASDALLDGLKQHDRVALTTFSHAVESRLELTADVNRVREELRRIAPSGRTAILDAVFVALTTTFVEAGRSLIVVCTDASDISSWLQPADVIESARRSNAVIYPVTSLDSRREPALGQLAEVTGGELLRISSTVELRAALLKILQDFRSRYVLAYSPRDVSPGGFHRLDVKVKRRGLTVRARPGYVGFETRK